MLRYWEYFWMMEAAEYLTIAAGSISILVVFLALFPSLNEKPLFGKFDVLVHRIAGLCQLLAVVLYILYVSLLVENCQRFDMYKLGLCRKQIYGENRTWFFIVAMVSF